MVLHRPIECTPLIGTLERAELGGSSVTKNER